MSDILFTTNGECPCCGPNATFEARGKWLRDEFVCTRCDSIPRERALMWTIEKFLPNWRELIIHESSPGGRGASVCLAKEGKHYIPSQYFDDLRRGSRNGAGIRSEDLERLTFKRSSIDLHVTQDVFEHVFDPARAFKEIARTLRPGGLHIFTTPLIRKHLPSEARAKKDWRGRTKLLAPAEYHGNPLSGDGSLVTMHWGYDISDFIRRSSGLDSTIVHLDIIEQGIRAEYIEVIVTRKP